MLLRVARHHFESGAAADVVSSARRNMTRIDAKEIASGRQHVDAPARGRASRAGLDKAAAQRAQQRRHLRFGASGAHGVAIPRAAKNMESVADAHFLHVAEPGVELRQRGGGVGAARDAAFRAKAAAFGLVDNGARDEHGPTWIESRGIGVFVEHLLDTRRVVVQLRLCERRRQMADGDRAGASLRLCGFAGVVDDERIDQRRWSEHRLRRAVLAEHRRFSRKPFERAMRSKMNQRVDGASMAQP